MGGSRVLRARRDLRRAAVGITVECRKADRSIDRALHDVARDSDGPVRVVVKETPHEIAVNVPRIAGNDVLSHSAATLDSLA